MSTGAGKTAVLLLAHGTPDSPDEVPEYMKNITGGRPIPDAVMEEVKHRYGLIGRSPLTDITMRQAAALQKKLQLPVYVGMRNWHPFIADTVKQMAAAEITDVLAICLAPQNSRTSVGLYKRATLNAVEATGGGIRVTFVDTWHDHYQLAAAFSLNLLMALHEAGEASGQRPPVIFTAHSVPCRTVAESDEAGNRMSSDAYANECKLTARAVAKSAALGDDQWFFAFQSQGMSGGPWIGPTVEDTLKGLAEAGHKSMVMQPVGFVCDHVEVLYDIDIAFRKLAKELGMQLWRAESLNDSRIFIGALADVARANLTEQMRLIAGR